MKKIMVALIFTVCHINSYTQCSLEGPPDEYNYIIKNTPFVFEGEVIQVKEFYGKNVYYHGGDSAPYTSNIIKINAIFSGQGQIHLGTIEITTIGSGEPVKSGDEIIGYYDRMPNLRFFVGNKGIFLCSPLDHYPSLNIITDNSICLRPQCPFVQSCFINLSSLSGMRRDFKTRAEIYEFLGQFENITIPKEIE